jgi:L-ascorbate metabolism protein UlaG (beta-lactamase superfamily)
MISIQWLGVAGFRIEAQGRTFLLDPHLSGSFGPSPSEELDLEWLRPDVILISHGHVDHSRDLPLLMEACRAEVVCSETVGNRLLQVGFPRERVIPVSAGSRYLHHDFRLDVFPAAHVALEWRDGVRILFRYGKRALDARALARSYPAGPSLSFRISLFSGCRIQHFGSAGTTDAQLHQMTEAGAPDVLLLPFQPHRGWIQRIIQHVGVLKPRVVIPHHHDHPLPPFPETLDIRPVLTALRKAFPSVEVKRLHEGETHRLTPW